MQETAAKKTNSTRSCQAASAYVQWATKCSHHMPLRGTLFTAREWGQSHRNGQSKDPVHTDLHPTCCVTCPHPSATPCHRTRRSHRSSVACVPPQDGCSLGLAGLYQATSLHGSDPQAKTTSLCQKCDSTSRLPSSCTKLNYLEGTQDTLLTHEHESREKQFVKQGLWQKN